MFHELNIDNTTWGFGVNTALPVNLDYEVEAACWMIHDNFFQCMHDVAKNYFLAAHISEVFLKQSFAFKFLCVITYLII